MPYSCTCALMSVNAAVELTAATLPAAAAAYRAIVNAGERSHETLTTLGDCLIEAKQYKLAWQIFTGLVETHPATTVTAFCQRGRAVGMLGHFQYAGA